MANRWLVLAGVAGGVLLAGGYAFATQIGASERPAPTTNLSGVTVTAPQTPNALVNPASQFVRNHVPESRNQQYARFHDPICVKVQGLPEEFDAFIAKQVVEIAHQVHAPVDGSPDCTPNVNVVFTPSPQAQLNDIAKRRDILFGFHFMAEMKKLSTFSRPIQAWYVTQTNDATGRRVLEINDPNPWNPDIGKAPAVQGRAGSRLGNEMSSELVHALILADANKMADAKIGAIADYIAVLSLSRWQGLEHCNGISTILNLMADGCEEADRPEAATPSDLALLSGLYMVDPRELGAMQRAEIAGRIQTALKTTPDKAMH